MPFRSTSECTGTPTMILTLSLVGAVLYVLWLRKLTLELYKLQREVEKYAVGSQPSRCKHTTTR